MLGRGLVLDFISLLSFLRFFTIEFTIHKPLYIRHYKIDLFIEGNIRTVSTEMRFITINRKPQDIIQNTAIPPENLSLDISANPRLDTVSCIYTSLNLLQ